MILMTEEEAAIMPNGTIIGQALKAKWYKYINGDLFSFHTMVLRSGKERVFRANNKTWPATLQAGVDYSYMRNATNCEVELWHVENGYLSLPKLIEI